MDKKHNIVSKIEKIHAFAAVIASLAPIIVFYTVSFVNDFDLEGLLASLVITTPFLLHILAIYGFHKNKSWARALSFIIAVIYFLLFPVGTIISICLILNLLNKEWDFVNV